MNAVVSGRCVEGYMPMIERGKSEAEEQFSHVADHAIREPQQPQA
jgi:hypothetical protein